MFSQNLLASFLPQQHIHSLICYEKLRGMGADVRECSSRRTVVCLGQATLQSVEGCRHPGDTGVMERGGSASISVHL